MSWFYAKGRERKGPVDDREFDALIASGAILPTDLVWQPALPDWRPLQEVRPAAPVPAAPEGAPPLPPAAPLAPTPAAATVGPRGVGGWLLVFCLLLTIAEPIYGLSGWVRFIPRILSGSIPLSTALIFSLGSQLLIVTASVVVGILIWSGRPDGRSLAKKYLMARAAFIALLICVNVGNVLLSNASFAGVYWFVVLRSVVLETSFFLIWWSYFEKSVRVRNTYGAA